MSRKISEIFPAGFFAALPTPLMADGQIDDEGISSLVENALDHGLDGLYVGGSTGEGFLFSPEDRAHLFKAAASAADGRLKLIAQVGALEISQAEKVSASAAAAGFDAISTTPPLYFRHSNDEMKSFYKAIQQAANRPLVLYEVPALIGRSLPNSFFCELAAEIPISGIKFTSTDIMQLVGLCSSIKNVSVFYGVDEILVAGLAAGAHGGIGSTYNLLGRNYIQLAKELAAGEIEAASGIQAKANAFIDVLSEFGMPASLKACLEIKGLCKRHMQRPFSEIADGDMKRLETALLELENV